MTVAAIAEVLGGQKALKRRIGTDDDLVSLIRKGLPIGVFSRLAENWTFDRRALAHAVGISPRTLSRRISSGGRLSAVESDRTVRLARMLAFANEVFGDRERASHWLLTRNLVLGERPFDLMDTDAGIRSVETILGRIAWGIYS